MTKKIEPDFSFTPDMDRVEAYKAKQQNPTEGAPNKPANNQSPNNASGGSSFLTLMLFIILIGAALGGWWLYQQQQRTVGLLNNAELRIQSLESQLSATGEEMGESTVAMRAKLNSLATKTDELWDQMDKLWASAWRKNQAEIKDLSTANATQDAKITAAQKLANAASSGIATIGQKQQETEITLEVLAEQVEAAQLLKQQLTQLRSQMDSTQSKLSSTDKNQIQAASRMSQLETTQNALLNRIKNLEAQLRSGLPGGN